jgi:molybdate transport system substrate-binding protein
MLPRPARDLGLSLLCFFASGGAPLFSAEEAQPVSVFAASAAAEAMRKIGAAFTERTGTPVQITAGGSVALSGQILQGAAADIFVPEGSGVLVPLLRAAMVDEGSTIPLASNGLVVAAPLDRARELSSPEQMAGAGIHSLSLADPASIPLGILARRSLKHLGLWDKLQDRIRVFPDVRESIASVESGKSDLGIFYATDVALRARIKVVLVLTPSSYGPIRYSAALVGRPGASPAARSFLQFLRGAEAHRILLEGGLTPSSP